jgi:demethylmenaquinone methyltransferase/2-methoxy-6-polyprenyl-1,4-benzoquinol methylase
MPLLICKLLRPKKVIGIDISEGMMALGRQKVAAKGLQDIIELKSGDSEAISFSENTFDAITVAFGVRNFQNLEQGLQEMNRVLKPGGKLVILEFSQPKQVVFKSLYNLYMKIICPGVGKWISKNREAYKYLHNSVKAFPEGETFLHILQHVGFSETSLKRLSLGICTIYCGKKTG